MTEPTAPEPGAPAPEDTDEQASAAGRVSARAQEWLAQLQKMIEEIAREAAPTIRQVGAKAAELTAIAAEKAGPIAQRAAHATEEGGARLAGRARQLAGDLRHETGAAAAAESEPSAEPPVEESHSG